jgi:hypothetical protein
MPQPEHSAARPPTRPESRPILPPSGDVPAASRRVFLGLGGALTLAVAGAAPALASTVSASASPASPSSDAGLIAGCPTGKDPGELTAARASLARSASLAAARATPVGPNAVAVRRSRIARCRYLSRAQWGADESYRFDAADVEIWPPTYWPVQTFTVHHTADGSTDPDNASRLRTIYHNQAVGQGYGDLGYQFVIDDAGTVYEGRWSGDDGVPGFNLDGQMVNGAHVGGYNAGNVGIALLGDFTTTLPTAAAYGTLVRLLAGLTRWQNVDPLAQVHYVNPISGATADVPAIAGHRNWAATQCPGNAFAPLLGQLRTDVVTASGPA